MAKFGLLTNIEATLKLWVALLNKGLNFQENFTGYEWEGEIPAGTEKIITHGLGVVPSRFIITDATGTNLIVRGNTLRPTEIFFYVKNISATDTFKGKILIMP